MRGIPRSRRRILIIAAVVIVAVGLVRAWDASRQPDSGDGWQILARQRGIGDRNTVRMIEDQAAFESAWATLLMRSDPPAVDFGRSVVAWLTPIGTLSCPTRLDAIQVDLGRRVVDGAFSLGLSMGCASPPVGDSFLVAIDRDRLPSTPYRVRILGPDPTGVANGELEVADLT